TYYPGVADVNSAQAVTVGAGQTVSGIQFTIKLAPVFNVSGIVVDDQGRPVGSAMITVMPATPAGGPIGPRGMSRSEADGSFLVSGLPAGAYRLMASVPTVVQSTTGGGAVGGVFSVNSSSFGSLP